jgi:hypothetical protein
MHNEHQKSFAYSYDAKHIKSTTSNILRQSAYFITVIPIDTFLKQGAKYIDYGVYYIHKEYNGSPTNETCALVGIPILHVDHFYKPSSELIDNLKTKDEFKHIASIESITCTSTCDILQRFKQYFETCDNSYLLLLNIEPKGLGKFQYKYPVPKFTIPGGTMEDEDCNDFERCALREFIEETNINMEGQYEIIAQKRFMKDVKNIKKRKFGLNFFSKRWFDDRREDREDRSEHREDKTGDKKGDNDNDKADQEKEEIEEREESEESTEEEEKPRRYYKRPPKVKLKTVSMYFFVKVK